MDKKELIQRKKPTFYATEGKVHGPYRWYCMDESGYSSTYILPEGIFTRLRKGKPGIQQVALDIFESYREYDKEEEAYSDLSNAVDFYIKEQEEDV